MFSMISGALKNKFQQIEQKQIKDNIKYAKSQISNSISKRVLSNE